MTIQGLNLAGGRSLSMIHSAEGAECGLACLAMIARYHGHDLDLNGLRQRYSMSLAGSTLRNLIELAGQLGLASRALRIELSDLAQVKTPAILHWDLNHFVVLKSVRRGRATIHDPARGVRALDPAALSDHFTGVVLELEPAADFKPVEARIPVRIQSLWSDSRGLIGAAGQLLVLSLALQIFAFAAPFQTQLVIDQAIGHGDADLLTVLAWGFGLLMLIQAAVTALRAWVTTTLGALLSYQIVGNVVRHMLRLPATFFERRHVGDILSRINSTGVIQDTVTRGVISSIIDGLMALVAGLILFAYSAQLALIVVATLALSILVALAYYPVSRRRTQEGLYAAANERSYLMETVRAATTIKVMGRAQVREGSWRNLFARSTNIGVLTSKYNIWITLLQSVLVGLQAILVVYFGARMVILGQGFTVGMLIAFLSFRQTFSDRVISLINQTFQFRMLSLHLDRIGDIVAAAPESALGAAAQVQVGGAILVQAVSFRYGDPDPLVLRDVDLTIPAGAFVAITGPSGGGKSTLLKLMLGLQSPSEGEILLDGRKGTPDLWPAWRQRVGVVSQNDNLLSGSIADNIAFFDPDLDMEAVQNAARAACVHDEIMRMPMQYQALIGDMGSTLSGGQRQRVLLARALYRDPQILFLDEGTANLDEETEGAIAQLIAALPITRIVVAHRPALINKAQMVVEIRDGQLRVLREGRASPAGDWGWTPFG